MSDRFAGDDQDLPPGVTLDPKDQAALEAAFGVSSNAEELVRANANRYSREFLTAQRGRVDPSLTSKLYVGDTEVKLDEHGQIKWAPDQEDREFTDELIKHIGHPIEDAVVRGSGRRAMIIYVFQSPRGGLEKDYLSFKEYSDSLPKASKAHRSSGHSDSHKTSGGSSSSHSSEGKASKPAAKRSRSKRGS